MNAIISYQTLHLPPPFAFAYTLELEIKKKKVSVNYQLEYLNRDTLSEKEILSEGFTTKDDFEWKGELGEVWSAYLTNAFQSLKLGESSDNDPIWIHIKTDQKEGNFKEPEKWDFILQELIQAIYEVSGHELPLSLKIIQREGGKSQFYELSGHFVSRKATINDKPVKWEEMQSLVSGAYSFEFGEDSPPVKNPDQDGFWIDPTGQSGYFLADSPSGKKALELNKLLQQAINQ